METKKVTKIVYIANDGKEFLTEEECKKHEKYVTLIPQHFDLTLFISS